MNFITVIFAPFPKYIIICVSIFKCFLYKKYMSLADLEK